jgi:choline oxidase
VPEQCVVLNIGGGSAGCIVARRLAERSNGRIILLEAGQSDEHDPAALDLKCLDEQTETSDWGFTALPLPSVKSGLRYARAKMLCGCANHNDCAFIRPPDSDFLEWQALGARGWGPADMAPHWARITERVTIAPCPLTPMSQAFIAAGQEMGLPLTDFGSEVRAGLGAFPLNAAGRMRHSSSVAYLHPLAALPKHLDIWTGVTATRLLFHGQRACGAETTRGTILADAVVLACGAIQTPQLLMVSGIGPSAHLRDQGIPVIAANEAVGRHLRDHVAAPVIWSVKQPVGAWDVCPFEATMLLQLDHDAPAPDILFHFGLRMREKYVGGARFPHTGEAVKASPNVARARSKGSVRLTGPTMFDRPEIKLNYFSDPYDLPLLIKALRFARRMKETAALAAFVAEELFPGNGVETDAEWETYVKSVCETVYHPCGTAAIGKAVDEKLCVVGTDNLYVVDASVFPSLITVNINSAVMMVAEKAATLIPV